MERPLRTIIATTLEKQNLSIREFARRAGVSHPTISSIINGEQPSYDVCAKIAPVLKLPLELVLRSAGLLTSSAKLTDEQQHMLYLFNSLEADQREIALVFLQALHDKK